MNRDELAELHYIAPIANVPSILEQGILSHKLAQKIKHDSVAKPEIQRLRKMVTIPGGRPLHEYANLYFSARNPMMYLRRDEHASLCILQIATEVIDVPRVVITDQNAASDHARFGPAPNALRLVDRDKVFAESWKHPDDQIAEWRHKSRRCAEVLVPERIDPSYVTGGYVSCEQARAILGRVAPELPLKIHPHLFFCRQEDQL